MRGAEKDALPPGGGVRVPAGDYAVVFTLGDQTAHTTAQVRNDPRVSISPEAYADAAAHDAAARAVMSDADEALQAVARALKTLDVVSSWAQHLPETETFDDLSDSLRTALTDIQAMYTTPAGFKGYDHVTRRVSDVMWTAMGRNDWTFGPGDNARRALELAQAEVAKLVAATDEVMADLWGAWLAEAEALERSPEALFDLLGRPE
jgi:hypothetical protein